MIELSGHVKYYDKVKGYGFIETDLGSVLFNEGHVRKIITNFKTLLPKTKIHFIAKQSINNKGLRVDTVLSIDESYSELPINPIVKLKPKPEIYTLNDNWYKGYLKWFNQKRGFGFVAFEHSTIKANALLNITTIKDAGIDSIYDNECVYVQLGITNKGVAVVGIRKPEIHLLLGVN